MKKEEEDEEEDEDMEEVEIVYDYFKKSEPMKLEEGIAIFYFVVTLIITLQLIPSILMSLIGFKAIEYSKGK